MIRRGGGRRILCINAFHGLSFCMHYYLSEENWCLKLRKNYDIEMMILEDDEMYYWSTGQGRDFEH